MDIGFTGFLTTEFQSITVSTTRRTYRRLWTKPSARLELACRFVGTLTLRKIQEALSTPAADTDTVSVFLHILGMALRED